MASGIVEPSGSREQKEQEEQQKRLPVRSRLVERLLAGTPSLPAFIHDLITAQAMVVAGTEAIAFLIEPAEEDSFALKLLQHVRPDDAAPDVRQAAISAFAEIVRPCIAQNKDGAIRIDGTQGNEVDPQFCLVTLLRGENNMPAVVTAVIARCPSEDRAKQRLQLMELIAGYFDMFSLKRRAEQAQEIAHRHQHVLQFSSAVATSEGFKAAAMNLCNELAAKTGASRVSIGWVKGTVQNPKIKLQGMSHTEQFDRKQELSVQIEKVMEECFDQEEIVRYDPDGTGSQNIAREATNLSRLNGGEQVVSLPLRRGGEVQGIITLEFSADKKVAPNEATALAVAVELLGPTLYDRHENDRWLITKAGISTRETFKMIVGPKYWLAKTIVVLVLAAIWALFGAWVPVKGPLLLPMYRVAAKFAFQANDRRTISAPFEGVLEEVYVKPGAIVKKGDKLAKMKTTEMEKQLWDALSRAGAAKARENKASGEGKEADRQVAAREYQSAMAEADLLKYRVNDLAVIKATIDGEVLVGDLEDKQGSTVKQGDELFQLAVRDSMRAELQVAERDIQDLKVNQAVWLATNALPTESKKAVIEQIVPLGESREGANTFKVLARLEETNEQWRPGMQGEARVEVEPRTLAWQWTHRFVDFLRLKLWM
jgi:multidrug resistance efflux pump